MIREAKKASLSQKYEKAGVCQNRLCSRKKKEIKSGPESCNSEKIIGKDNNRGEQEINSKKKHISTS